MSDSDDQHLESVEEPTERDVLCGRGGMSNHHQGNEWYRRLIRSNRPLYRACPKHTKLLVSKAIVQAVEEQSGRFLERSRKTGLWYIVPYKRAVDKTSQGLRERDKDEEDGPPITSLPESLRAPNGGKITKPNLKELAHVTMQHAGMPTPSPAAIVGGRGPQLGQQAKQKKHDLVQQQRQQMAQQQKQLLQQQQFQQQQQMQQQMVQQQQQQQQRGSFFSMGSMRNSNTNEPLDATAQPGLLASQSSMFRILSRFGGGGSGNDTRRQSFMNNNNSNNNANMIVPPGAVPSMPSMSGPGVTAFMGLPNNNSGMVNNNNLQNMNAMAMSNNSNNNTMNSMNSLAMANNSMNSMNAMSQAGNSMMGPMNNNMNNNNMNMNSDNMGGMNTMGVGMNNTVMPLGNNNANNGSANNMFPTNQRQFQQQVQMQQQLEQQQQQQQQEQQQSTSAPALTRLTTQVSDWLTSFWPVSKGGEDPNKQQQQRREQQQRQRRQSNNNMGPGRRNTDNSLQNQMMQQQNQLMMGDGGGGRMNSNNNNNMMGPPSRGSFSNRNSNMPIPSHLSSAHNVMDGPDDIIAMEGSREEIGNNRRSSLNIPPPAQLESSVSTTLLKLASSPSKMLAGISTFFSNAPSGFSDSNPEEPNPLREDAVPPPPPAGLGMPLVGRPHSNRSSDLLDDYEETELEARMRAVAGS